MEEKNICAHCSKEDCKECVTSEGKKFCCDTCCADYKEKAEKKSEEPTNVCKFC